MPLAVAVTLAVPVAPMVAGLPVRIADAPLAGGVNVTRPPATGSIGLLAVTVTTSGAGKAVSTPADWPLPEVTAMVNPLDSKAPMSTTVVDDAGEPALVGGDAGGDEGVVARVDGRAAGQQGHRLGRAAVVAQRGQQGIERRGDGAGQVGADPAAAAVGLADQVVALGDEGTEGVGPAGAGRVLRHDRVAEGHRATPRLSQAAARSQWRSCR